MVLRQFSQKASFQSEGRFFHTPHLAQADFILQADRRLVSPSLTVISAGKVWIETADIRRSKRWFYILPKKVMALKAAGQVSKEKSQPEKSPTIKKENLSRKDIEELMGCNRDTYTRRNGAVRRK